MKTKLLIASILLLIITVSSASAVTPAPTTLTNDTGNGWVQFDWNAGTGNVTDTYNISRSIDSTTVWYNGTTNDYIKWSGLSGDSVTIYVYGFNTTYSQLSTGITDTLTVPMLFASIVNLLEGIVPLFSSLLDLIVAIFPLVIAFGFLAGLALLIGKLFNGVSDFGFGGKKK